MNSVPFVMAPPEHLAADTRYAWAVTFVQCSRKYPRIELNSVVITFLLVVKSDSD